MSTYYKFYCDACKQSGGCLTTQAWGTGNFDIIRTFKFVMRHALKCGESSVRLCSEYSEDFWRPATPPEEVEDIFPSSNDWQFIAERYKAMPWIEVIKQWHANEAELKARYERGE